MSSLESPFSLAEAATAAKSDTLPKPLSRRAAGAFYTPARLADYAAREAMLAVPHDEHVCVLDPACGDGQLLKSVLAKLIRRHESLASDWRSRLELAQRCMFGIDRNEIACREAREQLARLALGDARPDQVAKASESLRANVVCGDALLQRDLFPGRFDIVVANPPFINIRRLGRAYSPVEIEALRSNYTTAVGNFDLYVLFLERALQWLKPGGRAACITPNKLATLKYAETCRRMLLSQTTIESVLDASAVKWFDDADVYPYVWVLQKQPAKAEHQVIVRRVESSRRSLDELPAIELPQREMSSEGFVLQADLPVEQRVSTARLETWGKLHSGASGFTAKRWLDQLVETDDGPVAGWEFIVSGNIDRYQIKLGDVRYLKQRFQRPLLQRSCRLTDRKRALYDGEKLVLAGMGRRLEAAYDGAGLALGVQVYALADFGEHGEYLLGILNSRLLTYLFRTRFAAKRLAGGYLAVNKCQLAQLPIVQPNTAELESLRRRLISAVRGRAACTTGENDSSRSERWEAVIDRLTYRLYGLLPEEVERVERAIA